MAEASPTNETTSGIEAVRAVARAQERDRYLSALLAPSDASDDIVTLAAFAGELQRIPGYVSQPILGEMRLQWWRDTLQAAIEGNAPEAGNHPVAQAMAEVARRRKLPYAWLEAIIDAQSARLDDEPFATFADLEANLVAWDGALFVLAWRILSGDRDGEAPPMLRDAGRLYGLCRVLAEAQVELLQGRALLPADLRARYGALVDIAAGTDQRQAWLSVIQEAARRALDQNSAFRTGYQKASREARLAALPVALLRPYLALSRKIDMTADVVPDIGPLTRVVRLWLGRSRSMLALGVAGP